MDTDNKPIVTDIDEEENLTHETLYTEDEAQNEIAASETFDISESIVSKDTSFVRIDGYDLIVTSKDIDIIIPILGEIIGKSINKVLNNINIEK